MSKDFYYVIGQSGREYVYLTNSIEEALDQHSRHKVGKNDPPRGDIEVSIVPPDEIGETDD